MTRSNEVTSSQVNKTLSQANKTVKQPPMNKKPTMRRAKKTPLHTVQTSSQPLQLKTTNNRKISKDREKQSVQLDTPKSDSAPSDDRRILTRIKFIF